MADTNKTKRDADDITNGLKFNSIMRDQTTTHIIKPKRDPAYAAKIAIGLTVALLALAITAYISFTRSGLNPFKDESDSKRFSQPEDRKIE